MPTDTSYEIYKFNFVNDMAVVIKPRGLAINSHALIKACTV